MASAHRPASQHGTQVLDGTPALRRLFGRAAVASVAKRRAQDKRLPSSSADAAALVPPARFALRQVTADAGELTRFQHHVGESAADRLPVSYVHILGFPLTLKVMTDADFPLPPLGMVHTANRVRVHRLPSLDEPLDLTAFTRALAPHRRGTVAEIGLTVHSGRELLLEETSVYLAKGVRLFSDGPEQEAPAGQKASSSGDSGRDAFEPPEPAALWRFTPADVRRYAALSGDANPIHTNPLAARAFGFPRTIAHGMYTAARALALQAPGGGGWQWTVRFAAPVVLPATVAVGFAAPGDRSSLVAWHRRSGKPHLWSDIAPLD